MLAPDITPKEADRNHTEEVLREQDEFLRVLTQHANDFIRIHDLDGRSVYASPSVERLYGRAPTNMFEFAHPEDIENCQRWWKAIVAGGTERLHWRVRDVDGQWCCLETSAAVVQYHNKPHVLTVCRDVTERRRAEQELLRTTALLRAVIEGTTDAVFVKDRGGRYLLCNEAAARFMGRAVSDVLGNEDTNFFDPVSAKVIKEHDQRVMESGDANTEEEELTVGTVTRVCLVTKAPYRDGAGNVVGVIGIARDITERKRTEIALRAAEERLEHVIGSSPAVLFTLEIENGEFRGINWLSPNIEALLGYRAEEALGADWWLGNIHPEDRDTVVNQFLSEIVSENYFSAEYRFRHKDGGHRWIRGEIRLLRNEAGLPTEAIGSLSDITERKQLEDQFRQAQKMEVIGRLAGGMAHDFNNLLSVILGCCQIIEDDAALSHDSRGLVEEVYKAANRAAALTKQLLAFSRRQILQPKLLNLNEVVIETVAMLDHLIGEDITLKANLHARLWSVKVDASQMNQVIMNLAVNARDAMPQGGTLTIETSNVELDETFARSHREVNAGPYVMLVVSDSGSGMDEQTKSRIFEPFFTTKETGKGTGLGLATVFGIVKQSEGHVTVDSELGKGTTFKVYLPRYETPAESDAEASTAASLPRGTETVLVAEDDAMMRKLTSRILSSQGYSVLQAADGDEALRVYRTHEGPIHLLLADVVMPKMDGAKLYDQLSAIQPGLKVLFTSGYTDDAVLRRGVLESTTNFIEKPFTYAALATSVRRTLDAT